MSTVDVHGSSLQADSQLKLVEGLRVGGRLTLSQLNCVNSRVAEQSKVIICLIPRYGDCVL